MGWIGGPSLNCRACRIARSPGLQDTPDTRDPQITQWSADPIYVSSSFGSSSLRADLHQSEQPGASEAEHSAGRPTRHHAVAFHPRPSMWAAASRSRRCSSISRDEGSSVPERLATDRRASVQRLHSAFSYGAVCSDDVWCRCTPAVWRAPWHGSEPEVGEGVPHEFKAPIRSSCPRAMNESQ